jgi:undecaprenyl-diphosphatase
MDESSTHGLVALGMGALQGVTEFLPISSDGHLALFAFLVDVPEMSLALVLLLHVGTLLATFLVFRHDLLQLAKVTLSHAVRPKLLLETTEGKELLALFCACVPTAVIGLFMKERVEALSATPWVVGAGFLASAAVVYSTRGRNGALEVLGPGAAFLIGVAQGIAVLPGVSRSGLTIACALLFGMTAPAAFRFSFLLSIPVIAGATALKLGEPGVLAAMDWAAWLAAVTSFVVGWIALKLLAAVLTRGHFWLFSLYLLPLGAIVLALSFFQG